LESLRVSALALTSVSIRGRVIVELGGLAVGAALFLVVVPQRPIRQARVVAGITQVPAAVALRKPQSFVSKCESGGRRVDVIELQDFAKLCRSTTSCRTA
jgi:hypothetical protein